VFLHGMLRTERFKLVVDYQTGAPVELFDLDADPAELTNLVDDPAYAKTKQLLTEQLLDISAST
jgi:arylsulfatase A-like enzyme